MISNPNLVLAIWLCALSAGMTWFVCRVARPMSAAFGLVDLPDERKRHGRPTPLMGGVVLLAAVLPALTVLFALGPHNWALHLLVLTGATAVMTLVGLADDRHHLPARWRLAISFVLFVSAALVDPGYLVRVMVFEHPRLDLGLVTGAAAMVFTTVCIVGLINAINMADGKNGLVIGLCLGWLGLLALRAPEILQFAIAIVAASWAVLLVFNLRGKLFLGDGGAYGIATALGMLAILIYNGPGNHAGRAVSAEELVVLFCVPVLDSFRLTIARLLRGQSPMAGDRDHLHHHLQNRLGWPAGLVAYWLIALVPPLVLFLNA